MSRADSGSEAARGASAQAPLRDGEALADAPRPATQWGRSLAPPSGMRSFDVGTARRSAVAAARPPDPALFQGTGSFDPVDRRRSSRGGLQAAAPEAMIARLPRPQAGIAGQFAMPVLAPALDADRPRVDEPQCREAAAQEVEFRLFTTSLTPCLESRFGWYVKFGMVLIFLGLDSSRFIVDAWALNEKRENSYVLAQALVCAQAVVSFSISSLLLVGIEGCSGLVKAFNNKEILLCLPISVGFALASACLVRAYSEGMGAATSLSLGLLYMPLCAFISRWLFQRAYGMLDIQALVLLTLSSLSFAEMRARALNMSENLSGSFFVFASVIFSSMASIFSEWMLKHKYNANTAQSFYSQMVRLQFWGFFISVVVLKILTDYWNLFAAFRGWDTKLTVSLCIRVLQSWMAMVLARHLSTVAKAVIQCLSLVIVFFVGDLWLNHLHSSYIKTLVICFLTLVVGLCTLLYQMGREQTISMMQREVASGRSEGEGAVASEPAVAAEGAAVAAAEVVPPPASPPPVFSFGMKRIEEDHTASAISDSGLDLERPALPRPPPLPGPAGHMAQGMSFGAELCCLAPSNLDHVPRTRHRPWMIFRRGLLNRRSFEVTQQRNPRFARWLSSQAGLVVQVGCVVLFIMSDASRTVINEWALTNAQIVQQSVVFSLALASIVIGTVISAVNDGWSGPNGVKAALSPTEALRYLPVSAMFSVSLTCQTYAYAFGITAVENTVIGYSYTPLSAVLSRFIFKRYYSVLEWIALLLLMLSATAFVLMQDQPSSKKESMSTVGIFFVLGSVVFSCLGSVLAEKLMQKGKSSYNVQKVQLEVGDLISSVIMFFVTGNLSKRPKDAFWKERPVESGPSVGIYAGWNWSIVVVLIAWLVQSWLGGLVAKQLSTVIRAVAQCLSLLLIYFVGDLLVKHVKFDWVQGCMAIVVAMTAQAFILANPQQLLRKKEDDASPSGLDAAAAEPAPEPPLPPPERRGDARAPLIREAH